MIGAALVAGAAAPKLVSRAMLKTMRPGAVRRMAAMCPSAEMPAAARISACSPELNSA